MQYTLLHIFVHTIYGMIWLVYWLSSTEWGPHIQDDLGLAVADSDGAPLGAWTFNLSFNLATSLYSEDGDSDGRFNHQQRMKSGKFHGNRMVKPTLVYRTLDFMDLNAFFFRDIRTVDFSIDLMGTWWISKWWLNGIFMGISWLELTNCSFNNVPPIEMNNSNTFPQEFLVGYWILIGEIGWWINESDCKYRLRHGYKWESVVSYQSIISQYRYMIQVQVRTWMKG